MGQIFGRTFLIFTFVIYSIFMPQANLYSQDTCAELLSRAEQNYFEGRFDDTISLIKSCLTAGTHNQDELFRAYKILAQAYLAKKAPEIVAKTANRNPSSKDTSARVS